MATTVRLISDAVALVPLEASWNSLAADTPLRSYEWLATWWKYYGPSTGAIGQSTERRLFVLAVYRDVEPAGCSPDQSAYEPPIGIAPWYVERVPVKGNVIRWLGDGEVCTDHPSILCRSHDQSEVIHAIAQALTTNSDEWDQLDLRAVDAHEPITEELLIRLEEHECNVSRQQGDTCWILDLPSSWDDYLSALSKSHRKQLRQLERRVLESDRTCWHQVKSGAELSHAWSVLVELHQRRRNALGEPGCFASPQFYDFHWEVVRPLLDHGQLRISWLELDGVPAAAEYHFADQHTTFAYQGGVDPARLAEEPGRLSTILCLQEAIHEGHRQFDFLRGDEPYKAHWRATPRPTYDYRVVPNRRLARLRGRVTMLAETMTDWVRQGSHILAE